MAQVFSVVLETTQIQSDGSGKQRFQRRSRARPPVGRTPLTSTWASGRTAASTAQHDGVAMKRYLLAGLVLALVTTAVVMFSSPDLQGVALLGAALGGTLGLV